MSKFKAPVTNQRVADELGVSHSAISRIRSGDRLPSLQLVRVIEAKFGWPVAKQIETLDPRYYAAEFEAILSKRYNE